MFFGCFFVFLFFIYLLFFLEGIEFIAKAKRLMQVSLCAAAIQKLHVSCVHGSFLLQLFF